MIKSAQLYLFFKAGLVEESSPVLLSLEKLASSDSHRPPHTIHSWTEQWKSWTHKRHH